MENNCPICTKESVSVANLDNGILLKCPQCHWLFSNCTPKLFVKKDLDEEKINEYLAITQKASLLSGLTGGDKVLDVCSGDGMLLGWYLKSTVTVGVEPNASLMKEALNNKRIDMPIIDTFNDNIGQGLGPFKIITIIDVIQNMDFMDVLKRCIPILHPEGVLVFQTPYFPQELSGGKINPARNYLLAYTLHGVFQRLSLELQGIEFPKMGIRAYATFRTNKRFGEHDFDLKLKLYTHLSHAIMTELHARFDLEETYQRIHGTEERESRNIRYSDV